MELEAYQITGMIVAAQKYAVKATLVELGLIKPYLSKSEAYRLYSRRLVDRWLSEGILKVYKDGDRTSKERIKRMDLEALASENNRLTYLPVAERNSK